MTLLRRAALRFHLRHPLQLLLSILGVALGVALVVSIDLAIGSARAAFRASSEAISGRSTHQVLGGGSGVPDTLAGAIRRAFPGSVGAAPVVEGYALSPRLPGRALRILGVDPFSEAPVRPFLGEVGGLEFPRLLTTPAGILLGVATAAEAGVVPGDTLPLRLMGREVAAPVLGILDPADPLAREGVADLLLMDIAQAQLLLAEPGLSRIDLVLPDGAAGEEALRRIRSLLPPGTQLQPTGARTEMMADMTRAFDLNLTALSLLALVFGMFLIYNTMTFAVVRRRRTFGTLRALGVTRAELLRGILGEAALLGGLGAVAGVLLGIVLGEGLVGLVTRTINDLWFVVRVEEAVLSPGALLKGGVLGIGATLLASLPPAWEATSVTPRSALLRSGIEERARGFVPRAAVAGALLLAVGGAVLLLPSRRVGVAFAGLFPVLIGIALLVPGATVLSMRALRPPLSRVAGILGSLAARGVSGSLSRTAPAMAALVIAVSVTVGLGIMISSFRGSVVRWLDGTLQADVYLSPPEVLANRSEGTLPPELAGAIGALPGVQGVSTYRGREFATSRYGLVRVVALDLHPLGEGAIHFLEGEPERARSAFRAGEGIWISEPFAFRHDVSLGESLVLDTETGERALPVAGIFRDYGSDRGVVMMDRALYDQLWTDRGITSIGVFGAPVEGDRTGGPGGDTLGVGPGTLEASIREVVAAQGGEGIQVRSNRTLRELSLEVFDRTFAITGVLRALAFIVAFIGILSALMALQLERERELGVLRANGMTPGQLRRLITTQTGLMGLVAGVLAIPSGILLATVMIHVVNRRSFGWTLDMELGPALLLQSVALAVAGALLAGVYPALRMSRTSPAAALRGE